MTANGRLGGRRGPQGHLVSFISLALLLLLVIAAASASLTTSSVSSPRPSLWQNGLSSPATSGDPNRVAAVVEATRLVELVQVASSWASTTRPANVTLSAPASWQATSNIVDAALLWTTSANWQVVQRWVLAHPPLDSTRVVSSGLGYQGGVLFSETGFEYPSIPERFQSRLVIVEIAPLGRGRTGIRADAQVVWYPTRPRTEMVPAKEQSVTATVLKRSGFDVPEVTLASKTFTDLAVISKLAHKVDALPLEVPGARSCPANTGSAPRLELLFSGPGVPAVHVLDDMNSCGGVSFTISGHLQPPLVDDGLFHEVDQLLGISLPQIDTVP